MKSTATCKNKSRRGFKSDVCWLFICIVTLVASQASQAQTFSVLYTFTGGKDGGTPYTELVLDPSGNLYGTTYEAGKFGFGTVFRLGSTGALVVLHAFGNKWGGGNPIDPSLVIDAAGNLYGTTLGGGRFGAGTVFKISTKGVETVLHNFSSKGGDGQSPVGGVIQDASGNLYGTTEVGGDYNCNPPSGCGVVFKIDPAGNETILHAFGGTPDGANPHGGLVLDGKGNLYGSTFVGGTGICDIQPTCGTVFKIDSTGSYTVIHNFSGYPKDGGNPDCNLLINSAGILYGTTVFGGSHDWGTTFKINAYGKETLLYSFLGQPDGAQPAGALVRDSKGNLYGTTYSGGTGGVGTVFQLDSSGIETILHSFSNSSDGAWPWDGLTQDSSGNLYGAASAGGIGNCGGYSCGTIFKLSLNGGGENSNQPVR
jgi:uncharacterized repeat protein (TIGR03803 family)